MPAVLFVCTANRFRSPLAAAVFKKSLQEASNRAEESWYIHSPESWQVGSAGTWAVPGEPVLPIVYEAARNMGVELADHRAERVSEELLSGYDLILVMQASHQEALQSEFPALAEKIYLLAQVIERGSYDIPDVSGSAQEILEISAELDGLIRRGLRYICVLATALHNQRTRVK